MCRSFCLYDAEVFASLAYLAAAMYGSVGAVLVGPGIAHVEIYSRVLLKLAMSKLAALACWFWFVWPEW